MSSHATDLVSMRNLLLLQLKCQILSLKTIVGQLCKPHNMKDERLVSKMEGKTNFSSHLKQFDGLVRLTPTTLVLRLIYAVGLR